MSPTPIGTLEFFKLEAGEYLERLAALVGRAGGPGPDDLVRYARALRGAALMAQQADLGRAAAGLEAVGRGLREGRLTWGPALAEGSAGAVEELKGLLREVTEWGADQATRAARVVDGLQELAGPVPAGAAERPPIERRHEPGPDAGVRAFVARETTLIAGALDRAARGLAGPEADRSALPVVLRRMQSLRGLASLADLPPLPELLDGVERAISDLSRRPALPPRTDEALAAGARALSRIAQELAGRGRPDPAAPEATSFARLLLEVLLREPGVVPVTSLAPAGMHPVAEPGRIPVAAVTTLELVGHGEYLTQAAEELERAPAPATRGLRLFALAGVLQAGARPDGTGVGSALGRLHEQVVAVASDIDRATPAEFIRLLREVGGRLRAAGEAGSPAALAQSLQAVLDGAAPAPLPSPAGPAAGVVPIGDLLHGDAPTVAPAARSGNGEAAVPVTALLLESPDLAGSFVTLARHRTANAPAEGPAHRLEPVDVRQLLYRGASALARAQDVASALRAQRGNPAPAWEPLLDELLDLLPLTDEDLR